MQAQDCHSDYAYHHSYILQDLLVNGALQDNLVLRIMSGSTTTLIEDAYRSATDRIHQFQAMPGSASRFIAPYIGGSFIVVLHLQFLGC